MESSESRSERGHRTPETGESAFGCGLGRAAVKSLLGFCFLRPQRSVRCAGQIDAQYPHLCFHLVPRGASLKERRGTARCARLDYIGRGKHGQTEQ